jgi:hypothetical protein
MASQFLTAVGAFVGTFLGIWIAESASSAGSDLAKGIDLAAVVAGRGLGFMGTSVQPSDLVIPATAGGESLCESPARTVAKSRQSSSITLQCLKGSCTSLLFPSSRNCLKSAEA